MSRTGEQILGLLKQRDMLSYFDWETGDNDATGRTRLYGNVAESTPGHQDIQEAGQRASAIRKHFSDFKVNVDICDEWVFVTVTDREENK